MNSVPSVGSPSGVEVPAGACDCHVHVFGPYADYPLAEARSYTPPEATAAQLMSMLGAQGLQRAVLVQPSAYGQDHAALCAALLRHPERLRGVAVVGTDVDVTELQRLRALGVRAARFTETGESAGRRFTGAVGFDQLRALAPRLLAAGWHAQLWGAGEALTAALPGLLELGVPLVLDHLGMLDAGRGLADPWFQRLLRELAAGRIWVKVSPQRVSRAWPGYGDVRPLVAAMVEAGPRQLVWASDWPFLRMGERTPEPGALLRWFAEVVADDAVRVAILRDNAARLYGF